MLKEAPDHHDADLVLKIYDLRLESVMREYRNALDAKYWPQSEEEALAVTGTEHPLNAAFVLTSDYWEMVYGMARHGIIHADFLVENNGEGLLLFARVEPWVTAFRKAVSPHSFRNAEWVAANCPTGRILMEAFRGRVRRNQEAAR